MTELVEDDGELKLEFLAVLVSTIHSVTAREGLGGSGLVVGVVSSRGEGELGEVLEEVLLAFFEIEGQLTGLGGHGLLRGDEEARDLEGVVGDELVVDEHDAVVLSLGEHLTDTSEIDEGDSLTRVEGADDTNVQSGLLLQGL